MTSGTRRAASPPPAYRDANSLRVGAFVDEHRYTSISRHRRLRHFSLRHAKPAARGDRIGQRWKAVSLAPRAGDRVLEYSMGSASGWGSRVPAGGPRAAPAGRADERATRGNGGRCVT